MPRARDKGARTDEGNRDAGRGRTMPGGMPMLRALSISVWCMDVVAA